MDEKCLLVGGDVCVRFYNGEGVHVLSLLPCGVNELGDVVCVDLVCPDGRVLYCGVPLELVNVFVDKLGLGVI